MLSEALHLYGTLYHPCDGDALEKVYAYAASLYAGEVPGYRACNTRYHDFQHISETFLAMTRLIHGAVVGGHCFPQRKAYSGLIAALFHDAGYVQEAQDTQGTGAKYTMTHVQRSMDFVRQHAVQFELRDIDVTDCCHMIQCTDLGADFTKLEFSSPDVVRLGKLLGTADIMAQVADRTHLEKLTYLYQELREANIDVYASRAELIRKTMVFYKLIDSRFAEKLDRSNRFMRNHFNERWQIDSDLYMVALENERRYLESIILLPDGEMFDRLRRGGIMEPCAGPEDKDNQKPAC